MSKRFGRQQKRKMRAAIEQAETANNLLRHRNDYLESSVKDCAQILDHNFIGYPPREVTSSSSEQYFRVHKMDMLPVYIRELGKFEAESKLDNLNNQVHIRVRHPETGVMQYCIDKQTMEQMPKELLVRRLGEEFALQIAESL